MRRAASGLVIPVSGSIITESFDTADSTTLGPDLTWAEYYAESVPDAEWQIVSNRADLVRENSDEEYGWAQTDGSLLTDDIYVESKGVSCRMAGGNAFCSAGLVARSVPSDPSDTFGNGYLLYVGTRDIGVYLVKSDGSTETVLDSVLTGLPNSVHTFDLRIEVNGTSIFGEVTDGTSTWNVSATDSDYTSGDVGIFGQVGSTSGSADWPKFPAFEAGDL